MSLEDANSVIEKYVESETICYKNMKIYSALENILIRKEYVHNADIATPLDEMKSCDVETSNSNHHINQNKSLTKVISNCDGKVHKRRSNLSPERKCFGVLQKQIQQFESYKHCVERVSNKYSEDFLAILNNQNCKLSQKCEYK